MSPFPMLVLEGASPGAQLDLIAKYVPALVGVAALALLIRLFARMLFRDRLAPFPNIPGPKPSSWWGGSTLEAMATTPAECHEKWLDEFGPVIRVHVMGGGAELLCTDPKAVNYVMLHPDLFIKPLGPNRVLTDALDKGLVTVEGAEHRRQRRVLNPAFGWVQIQALTPLIMDKALEMRDKFSRMIEEETSGTGKVGKKMDVLHHMSEIALDIIGEAGFGYDFNAIGDGNSPLRNAYTAAVTAAFRLEPLTMLTFLDHRWGAIPTKRVRDMHGGRTAAQAIGREIVMEKKRQVLAEHDGHIDKDTLGKDVLSLMIRANLDPTLRPDQRLTDKEIVAQIATILFAGHETTSTGLMWCLYHLALNQDIQQRLREELLNCPEERPDYETLMALPYLDNVVHESLRLEPPVPQFGRIATQDTVLPLGTPIVGVDGSIIESIVVKKGTHVGIPITYMNRNPEIWGPDARSFNPDRRANGYPKTQLPGVWGGIMSFIGGPRNCIGHRLTVVEMKAVLFALLRSFVFELPEPRPQLKATYMIIQRSMVVGEEDAGPQMPLLVRPYVEE